MSFPKIHNDGEVWDGTAVTDLENRASAALVHADGTNLPANVVTSALLGGFYGMDSHQNIGIGTTLTHLVPGGGTASGTTILGSGSGAATTTAPGNTLIGANVAPVLTTSANNVVIGANAGSAITVGGSQVIIGQQAGQATGTTTLATDCIAIGYQSLQTYTGASSIAIGSQALQELVSATGNLAIGFGSGGVMTTGGNCTLVGYRTGYTNVSGSNMTAFGFEALTLSTGQHETGLGSFALGQQTSGNDNCAIGYSAGWNVVAGTDNTFVGSEAGLPGSTDTTGATGVGFNVNHGANYTTSLGAGCAVTAAGAVAIGVDSSGTGASSATSNVIALGTSNHIVQFSNNTTGSHTATLGTNGPMTTTTPNTWIVVKTGAGSTGYIPVWV